MNVKKVVVAGVQTPNCVRATAYDAIAYDYDSVVLSDATASKSKEVQVRTRVTRMLVPHSSRAQPSASPLAAVLQFPPALCVS